jgi:hypothetical protein
MMVIRSCCGWLVFFWSCSSSIISSSNAFTTTLKPVISTVSSFLTAPVLQGTRTPEDPWVDRTSRSWSDVVASSCQPSNSLQLDRRHAILTTIPVVGGILILLAGNAAANAVAGAEAKIELPNPYQQLADRASRQCLVESLGNRECLVFADDADKFVYQGVDVAVLLQRIEKSMGALATIPALVNTKQWSKITGVLTGPMGDLLQTLNQIAAVASDANGANQRIKMIKQDLYGISAAVGRKDAPAILKFHTATTNDLIAFVKAL